MLVQPVLVHSWTYNIGLPVQEAPKPRPTKRAKIESSDKSASIVKIKKEYDLPGQTRETPDEVGYSFQEHSGILSFTWYLHLV